MNYFKRKKLNRELMRINCKIVGLQMGQGNGDEYGLGRLTGDVDVLRPGVGRQGVGRAHHDEQHRNGVQRQDHGLEFAEIKASPKLFLSSSILTCIFMFPL